MSNNVQAGYRARSNNVQAGYRAQEKALEFLIHKGFELVEANFRTRSAEIDLVMKDGTYFVFVEVKYKSDTRHGLPREAVGPRKQKQIKKAALSYIALNRLHNNDFRFDVVEILDDQIAHIDNAFQ